MKLLILTQYFHPEQFRINMIAQAFVSRGHQVTILTGQPNYPNGKTYPGYKAYRFQQDEWQGVTIFRVPVIPRGSGKNSRLMLNYCSFMMSSAIFAMCSRRKKWDACFVFQPGPIFQAFAGVVLKKLYRVPLYVWTQDLWPETLSATGRLSAPLVEKIIRRFVGMIYRNSNRVLVTSKAFIPFISQFRLPASPVFLANACEDFYHPIPENEKQTLPNMPVGFKVMFTGNLGSAQALPTLIAAACILKDDVEIKWVFVGNGSELHNTKQLVKKYDLDNQIIFLGSHPAEFMPYIIVDADVCLATLNKSPIFALTLPGRIQSYMACEKPIISAIDGETARIIEEAACGIAVGSEDAEALAKAVVTLKNKSAEERHQMGKNGRAYYEKHFRSDVVIDKLTAILANSEP